MKTQEEVFNSHFDIFASIWLSTWDSYYFFFTRRKAFFFFLSSMKGKIESPFCFLSFPSDLEVKFPICSLSFFLFSLSYLCYIILEVLFFFLVDPLGALFSLRENLILIGENKAKRSKPKKREKASLVPKFPIGAITPVNNNNS